MNELNGTYALVATTPMGNQDMTLSIIVDGGTFSGTSTGAMGSSDVNGTVDGGTLAWTQAITLPMPLTLDCQATIDGDTIRGTVDTGAFGAFPINGTKTALEGRASTSVVDALLRLPPPSGTIPTIADGPATAIAN